MKKIFAGVVGLAVLAVAAIGFTQVVSSERWRTNLWLLDDKALLLGTLPDAALEYDTVQTPDTLVLGVPATSKSLLVVDKADMATDFGASAASNPMIRVQNSDQTDPTKFISMYHDGTNGVIDVGKGAVSFPDGISYANHAGQMAFSVGAAVTPTAWSVGRDADTPNQLHFNAPTGAGFEFSINDTAYMTMNAAAGLDLKANNFKTTGTVDGGAATFTSGDFSDGNISNVGTIYIDVIEADAATGLIEMKGATAGANKENLIWDFETVPNTIGLSSTTGVTTIDVGAILLNAGGADLADGDLTNVGNVQLDSIEADAAAGTITMMGNQAGGTNKEVLVWDFETTPNAVGVSTTSGVTNVDFGGINLGGNDATFTGSVTATGVLASSILSGGGGILTQGGYGGANNENLTWDFESGADAVSVASSTGVSVISFGAIDLAVGSLDEAVPAANVGVKANLAPQKRVLGKQGVDVASANDITLGDGNYFDVTGNTEVQRMASAGWTDGSVVILQFDSNPTVKHGIGAGGGFYPFNLAGGADFTASANDTLTLVFTGAGWLELSRSVN